MRSAGASVRQMAARVMSWSVVVVGGWLGTAPDVGAQAALEVPRVVYRDTLTFAPARLAITGYAGFGLLVEVVGSDPRQATYLSDSVASAWQSRAFAYLADAADRRPSAKAWWSAELDRYDAGMQGMLLGYVDVEGRRGQAELALTMYRRVFDVITTIPVSAAEAQRLLGRIGTALEAVRAGAVADSACPNVPELGRPATMPDVETRRRHRNGELLTSFIIGADGRAEPSSIEVLYASDRAFETSTRRFIERTTYTPATGSAGACRARVLQPFEFMLEPPRGSSSSKRTRIARLP